MRVEYYESAGFSRRESGDAFTQNQDLKTQTCNAGLELETSTSFRDHLMSAGNFDSEIFIPLHRSFVMIVADYFRDLRSIARSSELLDLAG